MHFHQARLSLFLKLIQLKLMEFLKIPCQISLFLFLFCQVSCLLDQYFTLKDDLKFLSKNFHNQFKLNLHFKLLMIYSSVHHFIFQMYYLGSYIMANLFYCQRIVNIHYQLYCKLRTYNLCTIYKYYQTH